MATGGPTKELCNEATCFMCADYSKDLVILDCGHNFCQACLAQHWGEPGTDASCPQCGETGQQGNLLPNVQLANVEEKAKEREGNGEEGEKGACEKHQKPLKLFCKDDQVLLCWECNRGKEHKGHDVIQVTQTASTNNETSEALPAIATDVKEEGRCPICKEYLAEPLSVDCGHNYCRNCITTYCQVCEGQEQKSQCPVCRARIHKENFRPNWQLANLVEKIKPLLQIPAKENLCGKHKMELNLFCDVDKEFMCVACERSPEHSAHKSLLLEDAARQYKGEIQAELQSLKKERDNVRDQKQTEEQKREKYLAELRVEKQMIATTFEQLRNLLEEQKHFCMAQFRDIEKEMEEWPEKNINKLSEEIARLNKLITEMEGKCRQPASEFLQTWKRQINPPKEEHLPSVFSAEALFKGFKSTIGSYEMDDIKERLGLTPDVEDRFRSYSEKTSHLKDIMEKFKESLSQALSKVTVVPDRDTAHPLLIPCKELKSGQKKSLRNNPERFDTMMGVLGHERFTSGRYWWEVEVKAVEEEATWAIGVAKESIGEMGYIKSNGHISFDPNDGIWAVGKRSNEPVSLCHFWTFNSSEQTHLSTGCAPRKIRVTLDYEGGRVEFVDADTDVLIYSFLSASFSGDEIRPFFFVSLGVELTC